MIIARGSLIFQQKCLNANVRTVPKFPSIGGGGDCSLKTRGVFCFVLLFLTRSFVESAFFCVHDVLKDIQDFKKINFAWKGSSAPEEHNNVTKIFVFARSWTYTF